MSPSQTPQRQLTTLETPLKGRYHRMCAYRSGTEACGARNANTNPPNRQHQGHELSLFFQKSAHQSAPESKLPPASPWCGDLLEKLLESAIKSGSVSSRPRWGKRTIFTCSMGAVFHSQLRDKVCCIVLSLVSSTETTAIYQVLHAAVDPNVLRTLNNSVA
jgi:hypothetical protein